MIKESIIASQDNSVISGHELIVAIPPLYVKARKDSARISQEMQVDPEGCFYIPLTREYGTS
jgi:hypothetical protein